jgi:hypothetical protein
MLNDHGNALAAGGNIPVRYLLCFGGYSLRGDLTGPVAYIPDASGPLQSLPSCLSPLDRRGLASQISVVSNLRIPRVMEGRDAPAGGYGEFHWHGPALLSGVRTLASFDATTSAPSSDQIVADALGGQTAFRNLNYRAQALFYNLGGGLDTPDNRDTLSFRTQGGTVRPMVPTSSPQLAWQTLFTGFTPSEGGSAVNVSRALARRRSVLDMVDWRMQRLSGRMSAADKARLQEHWDHIRTVEQRLVAVDSTGGACNMLDDPGEDPPLGGEFTGPDGNNVNLGYSDEDARAEVFADLIAMALACDRTRVVTWMITMWQTFMNAHPLTGHRFNAHDMHHGGEQNQLEDVITWHVDKWAGLVDRLAQLPEGDGTVLDHTAMALLNEGGTGNSIEGEGSHNTEQMAFLVAGGAGGLRQGEHIVAPEGTHAAQVPITLMNAVGVPTQQLGEVSGEVPGLRD